MDASMMTSPNGPVAIEPIPLGALPGIPARRSVVDWYAAAQRGEDEALELSLFITALTKFQSFAPEDQLSYFRIAGIHGYPPNVSWNMGKAPVPRGEPTNDNGGFFCPHNRTIFPTWHRAYLMLYERRISDLMREEAAKKTGDAAVKEMWNCAALNWRLPYWDWAKNDSLPELVTKPHIDILVGMNTSLQRDVKTVANPMYSFRMPGDQPMGSDTYGDYRIDNESDSPWSICKGTSRHGISWFDENRTWVAGITNVEGTNAALQGPYTKDPEIVDPPKTIQEAVLRLMNPEYSTDFETFATTKFNDKFEKGHLSLESIHNTLHNVIGGSSGLTGIGHMSSVPVAAFDPIFWLHHANVDRLAYLWQCTHPDKWLSDKDNDDHDSSTSHLRPFRRVADLENFYISNDTRDISKLHYTYDDMHLNGLYGEEDEKLQAGAMSAMTLEDPQTQVDPVINIVYSRYALGGVPYTVYFFLGPLEPNVPYAQQKTLVGSMHTFSAPFQKPGGHSCGNCKKQAQSSTLSSAQIPIQRSIKSKKIANDRTTVDSYLKKNLRWVATFASGSKIPSQGLPDLKISLVLGKCTVPAQANKWATFEEFSDAEWAWKDAEI